MALLWRRGAGLAVVVAACWGAAAGRASTYVVSSCKEFVAISTPMLDDTHVVVTQHISCKSAQTIIVSGPYAFLVSSDLPDLMFSNLRFSVKDGADFFINLSSEEYPGTASFVSHEEQKFHGGIFKVDVGSSLTFGVPVSFTGSSVVPGKSGGAIYNNGYVTFEQTAKFDNSEVHSGADAEGSQLAGCGGAFYNGPYGHATFREVTWFTGNTAGGGSGGGAVCNEGEVTFASRTYFTGNVAEANGQRTGGSGGAVQTIAGAVTTFRRKANFRNNRSENTGGAIYSEGVTRLNGSGVFSGNMAWGPVTGQGGHVYTSGVFEVEGDATFRHGKASQDGGALFVSDTGDASFNSELEFIDNEASRQCHDVYDASSRTQCLSVD